MNDSIRDMIVSKLAGIRKQHASGELTEKEYEAKNYGVAAQIVFYARSVGRSQEEVMVEISEEADKILASENN